MRTTVTLDDELFQRLQAVMRERRSGFKETLNAVLRQGLEASRAPKTSKRYHAPTFDLGKTMPGIDLDRIAETLETLENPAYK